METLYNFDFNDKYKKQIIKEEPDYNVKELIKLLNDPIENKIKKQNEINDIIFKINQYLQNYLDFNTIKEMRDNEFISRRIYYEIEFDIREEKDDGKQVLNFLNDSSVYSKIIKNLSIIKNILNLIDILIFSYNYYDVLTFLNIMLSFTYKINFFLVDKEGEMFINNKPVIIDNISPISSNINNKLKDIKTLLTNTERCVYIMTDTIKKSKLLFLEYQENKRLINNAIDEIIQDLNKLRIIQEKETTKSIMEFDYVNFR